MAEMRFDIAQMTETEGGTVRIVQADGGRFNLSPRLKMPPEVFDILAAGKIASVMVSVNFCNDVVRMWDAQEK